MNRHDAEKEANRPIETLRDGALKVSIFRNHGEHGPTYAMEGRRIWTDKQTGEIRESHSLSGSEPLRMAHLLNKGYERVSEYRQQDRQQSREQAQGPSQLQRRANNQARNGQDRGGYDRER